MSWMYKKTFAKCLPLLRRLPEGQQFDIGFGRELVISLQANTQEQVIKVRTKFPGCFWTKNYNKSCSWWEYTTTFKGVRLEIYACNESPPSCKAIVERKMVEVQIPIAFETRRIEKDVIVGWDCGATPVVDEPIGAK